MSPNRPEREDESEAPPPPTQAGRAAPPARATPVSGPAEVAARIDLHLSQCRRRRGVLSLLCVSVDTMSRDGAEVTAHLERRVRDEVSNRIGNAVRGSDAILRESERDACVVLPGGDAAVATRVARRLARLLEGDYRVAGELIRVGVRIGTACHPTDGDHAQDLMQRATERR